MSEIIVEELSDSIGRIAEKTGQAVRFHALRMMFELLSGEKMSIPDQKRLFNKAKYWTPEREY